MKRYTLALLPLLASTAFANGIVAPIKHDKKVLSYTLGINGGLMALRGKRDAQVLFNNVFDSNLPGSRNLSANSAVFEVAGGVNWHPAGSTFGLTAEVNGSYTHVDKTNTGVTTVLDAFGDPLNFLSSTTVEANYGAGIDLQPSLYYGHHRFYGLGGVELRSFKFTYRSGTDSFSDKKTRLGLAWGLGWEYMMRQHAIGLQFKYRHFNRVAFTQDFVSNLGTTTIRGNYNPDLMSCMVTYRYKLG